MNNLLCDDENWNVLYEHWIGERNYARDCAYTTRKLAKEHPEGRKREEYKKSHSNYEARRVYCNAMLRQIRKARPEQVT
ncbi:MAG: hypothetical protein AB2784_16835 [Candidatus Thiodiazotropha endolucinida]